MESNKIAVKGQYYFLFLPKIIVGFWNNIYLRIVIVLLIVVVDLALS
jgi:hypothetical protein